MAVAPILLPEIVDEIAAFLRRDKAALSRCSLVSRLWCQSSSRHLFHSLQLREPPPGFPKEPLDALHTFLTDNPRVRILVQELTLAGADGVFEVGISIHRLRAIMARLPALHTLVVGSLQLREVVPPDMGDPPQDDPYPPVRPTRFRLRHISLSASFCLGIHPTFLSRTLALFDHVGELHFQGSVVHRLLQGPHRFAAPAAHDIELARSAVPPAVTAVTMSRFDGAEKVLSVLPVFVDMGALESLRISRFLGHVVPMVDALLRRATNLRDVTLFFYRFASPNLAYAMAQVEQFSLPGLAACTHLQSVSLGMEVHLDYDLSDVNLVYWRRCLEVLSSTQPTVRRVTVSILTWAVTGTSYFEPLAALDWTLLDSYVARYPLLECVEVKVSSRSIAPWIVGVDEMCARLGDMFSARNRAFVRITFGEFDCLDC